MQEEADIFKVLTLFVCVRAQEAKSPATTATKSTSTAFFSLSLSTLLATFVFDYVLCALTQLRKHLLRLNVGVLFCCWQNKKTKTKKKQNKKQDSTLSL